MTDETILLSDARHIACRVALRVALAVHGAARIGAREMDMASAEHRAAYEAVDAAMDEVRAANWFDKEVRTK